MSAPPHLRLTHTSGTMPGPDPGLTGVHLPTSGAPASLPSPSARPAAPRAHPACCFAAAGAHLPARRDPGGGQTRIRHRGPGGRRACRGASRAERLPGSRGSRGRAARAATTRASRRPRAPGSRGAPGQHAAAPTRARGSTASGTTSRTLFDPAIPCLGLRLTDILTRVLNDIHPMLLAAVFVERKIKQTTFP